MARQFLGPPPPRAAALDAALPAGKLGRRGAPGKRGAVQSPAARRAATGPREGRGPEAGGSGPGRWRMCNTDKGLIVTNYFRSPGSDAVPNFSAHRRHGAESGLGQACLLRPPFPGHRPERRNASPRGSGKTRPNRHIFMARGLKLRGGSGPVRRGNGNRPRRGTGSA